jgi:hypothetical protein
LFGNGAMDRQNDARAKPATRRCIRDTPLDCPDITSMSKLKSFVSICALLRVGNIQHGDAGARAQSNKCSIRKNSWNKTRIFSAFAARIY